MAEQKAKRNLRQDLIEAANSRIQKGGIGDLSLRKLAKDTGVSTMATYHHFKNKEALLVQIAVEGYEQLAEELQQASASESDPQQGLRAIMRAYFHFALKQPEIYHLMFGREIQGKSLIPEFKAAANSSFYVFAAALKKQFDASGREADADTIGMTFWGTLHGLVCLVSDGTILYNSKSSEKLDRMIEIAAKGLVYIQ
ncbi:MAG: TetR/AcrR family transcriptional regulator [Pseudomonadota bacterium]